MSAHAYRLHALRFSAAMTVSAARAAADTEKPQAYISSAAAWVGKLWRAHLRLAVGQLALQAEVQGPEAAGKAGPQRRDCPRGWRVPRPQRQLLQAGCALRDPLPRLRASSGSMVSRATVVNCEGLATARHTAGSHCSCLGARRMLLTQYLSPAEAPPRIGGSVRICINCD